MAVLAAIALLTPHTMLGQTPPRFRHDPMMSPPNGPCPKVVYKSTPSPVDVETILVSTVTGRTVGVSVETHAHKERALAKFDFAGLARVLTK